jgi:hypothetical protein
MIALVVMKLRISDSALGSTFWIYLMEEVGAYVRREFIARCPMQGKSYAAA